jgi:AhpD family alkylhydroperoxidase
MARLSYVEPDQAPPEVREIYDKMLGGKPGSVQKLLAHRPELLKTFLAFYGSVGRSLERRLYELVYIRVSMINQCHYCMQHHIASSKRIGLTTQDWQAPRTVTTAGLI